MPELSFNLDGVEAVPYAAVPQLAFKLRITQLPAPAQPLCRIHDVMLRCQIRIDPGKRRYSATEQQNLHELFGEPQRWGQTVRSMLWQNVTANIPAFDHESKTDLIVPCTSDFNLAATKYFAALQDGEMPLSFMFSGTIFYGAADYPLQVEQISWEREAAIRLPVQTWRQMMQMYYPNTAWLTLHSDVMDRLKQFKISRGLLSWEDAIETLLDERQTPLASGEALP